jgi:hypothetical protein
MFEVLLYTQSNQDNNIDIKYSVYKRIHYLRNTLMSNLTKNAIAPNYNSNRTINNIGYARRNSILNCLKRHASRSEFVEFMNNINDNKENRHANQNEIDKYPTSRINCDDVALLKSKCVICLESFQIDDRIRRLPCLHVFHTDEIDKWLREQNRQCPCCKRDVLIL